MAHRPAAALVQLTHFAPLPKRCAACRQDGPCPPILDAARYAGGMGCASIQNDARHAGRMGQTLQSKTLRGMLAGWAVCFNPRRCVACWQDGLCASIQDAVRHAGRMDIVQTRLLSTPYTVAILMKPDRTHKIEWAEEAGRNFKHPCARLPVQCASSAGCGSLTSQ